MGDEKEEIEEMNSIIVKIFFTDYPSKIVKPLMILLKYGRHTFSLSH